MKEWTKTNELTNMWKKEQTNVQTNKLTDEQTENEQIN